MDVLIEASAWQQSIGFSDRVLNPALQHDIDLAIFHLVRLRFSPPIHLVLLQMLGRTSAFVCRSCQRAQRDVLAPGRKCVDNGLRGYATANTRQHPLQLAIIGSGPAGFYSAYRLLKALPDARVDMYEGLPSPYGLVRFGIAPDHPEAKV